MTKIMFSIKDNVSGLFQTPFVTVNRGEAIRHFTKIVNSPNNMVSDHPKDFSLYEIAEFDERTGLVTGEGVVDGEGLEFVINAVDLLSSPEAA